jgi:cytosine/adenosine deaminase-related metal-dependent hydrolase
MVERESDTGATERSTEPGQGPQTLAQLQATGAEVVGSDGERLGNLEEVGDADFLVS